jgi:hypothetical protein
MIFDYANIESNFKPLCDLQIEVFPDIEQMAQIKQNLDIGLLTVGDRGRGPTHLLASKLHFLMRQYRFGLSEGIRYFIELAELTERRGSVRFFLGNVVCNKNNRLERMKIGQRIMDLNLEAFNQLTRVECYELHRKRIIELNDNKRITNQQFQEEQPEYYQWFTANKFAIELVHIVTGFSKGLLEAHENLVKMPICQDESIRSITPIIDIPTMCLNTELMTKMLGSTDHSLDQKCTNMLNGLQNINMSRFPLYMKNMNENLNAKLLETKENTVAAQERL